jgi:hypothetical protein
VSKHRWISKALLISAGIALAVGFGLSMFFKIHQELGIAPNYGWRLGAIAFLVSLIATAIYFKMRTER